MEQQIHFCTTRDGARIAYATVGQGPPLVKAANWLSHLEFDWQSPIWRHLLREFARDHTFIRYDERGNGLSDWSVQDLSFYAWVDDLESVIAAANVDRFPLLGISQGGAVAIAYAVRHPERVSHLILYGAYARGWGQRDSPEEIEQRQAQLTLVRLGWGKDNPAFRQLWTSLYAPDATPEQAQSFNDLQRISTSPENAVKLLTEMGNINVVDLLPQVKVPTLVLHCRDEAGVPFEEGRKLAGTIPGARFVPLEGRNHLLLEGAPSWGTFVKEIRRFIGAEETSALTQATLDSGKREAKPRLDRTDLPERYSIISFLGVGGMGEVYLAEDTRLGRKVALKTLPAQFTNDKERLRRFKHEARAASALNHPNLLTIHEIGEEAGAHFIATEYIDGETLRAMIKRRRLKIDEALDIAQQCAFALTAAHHTGIVHRDIKPENIMVRKDGIVKVLDFGLAKLLEDSARGMVDQEADTRALVMTDPGRVLGTPQYMSPEQARGLDLDARTDIWSLGVVLYEMVAGRPPFRGETKSHTVVSILEEEPAPLTNFAPDTPSELQRIARKALTKDRDSRYQTARDLMIDLKSLRRDLDIQSEMRRSTPSKGAAESDVEDQPGSETRAAPVATSIAEKRSTAEVVPAPRQASRYLIGGLVLLLVLTLIGLAIWNSYRSQLATGAINSMAVLPFVNASNDPNADYFSDGMTESIINSLSQLPHTRVLARTTTFRYRNRENELQKVGNELGVDALLTGKVVQQGDNLTIQADLIRVSDGSELWGNRYNKKLSDVFAVQNEIASEISETLRLKLSSEDQKRVTKKYTADPEAYQLYLKGRFYWNKRSAENLNEAIRQFKAATDKDPNYALAYVGLADSYALMEFYAGTRSAETLPLARAAAERALQIDYSLAEAHASLGLINQYQWRWEESEREYQQAIRLNPNYPTAHQWYGSLLKVLRRSNEALNECKRAQEIDPLSPIIGGNVAQAYLMTGDLDASIRECQRVINLDPAFAGTYNDLAVAYLKKGMNREAVEALEKSANLSNRSSVSIGMLGSAYAITGSRGEGQAILKELERRFEEKQSPGIYVAVTAAGLGDKDQAFAWLERDFQSRSAVLPFVTHWTWFDSLRDDQRYRNLLQRMGLRP